MGIKSIWFSICESMEILSLCRRLANMQSIKCDWLFYFSVQEGRLVCWYEYVIWRRNDMYICRSVSDKQEPPFPVVKSYYHIFFISQPSPFMFQPECWWWSLDSLHFSFEISLKGTSGLCRITYSWLMLHCFH